MKCKILFALVSFLIVSFLFVFGQDAILSSQLLEIYLMFISAHLVWECYRVRNKALFLTALFFSTYVFGIFEGIFSDVTISVYRDFNSSHYIFRVLSIHALFITVFWLFWKPKRNQEVIVIVKDNFIIWLFNLVICIIILFVGQSGEILSVSSSYGQNQLEHTTLDGYMVIFAYNCYAFSGLKKRRLICINIFYAIYAAKCLLIGIRWSLLFLTLMLFVAYWQRFVSFTKLLWICIVGGGLMKIYEIARTNLFVLFNDGFYAILENTTSKDYLLTQQGDVFYASMRLVGLIDYGILTISDRLTSFFYFLISIFVPYSCLSPLANLPAFMSKDYPTGGGGLVSIFVYTWLGYLGVIFFGFIMSKLLSNSLSFKSDSYKIYYIFLLAQIGIWFPYYPIGLIKMCFYAVLVSNMFLMLHYSMNKYGK